MATFYDRPLIYLQNHRKLLAKVANQPSTIGTFVSSGCIRLTNEDIMDLYKQISCLVALLAPPSAGKPDFFCISSGISSRRMASFNEDARDVARALSRTEAFELARSQARRDVVCALQRIFRLNRLRLRGPRGAQDEFTAAIAQNLCRLVNLVARPPPLAAVVA